MTVVWSISLVSISFFDTVRNTWAIREFRDEHGINDLVLHALARLFAVMVSVAVTESGMSKFYPWPGCVVQGGVFSALGGKSIFRRVYYVVSFGEMGIAIGMTLCKFLLYLLFADGGLLYADGRVDFCRLVRKFRLVAQKLGLVPNGKTVLKRLDSVYCAQPDLVVDGASFKRGSDSIE